MQRREAGRLIRDALLSMPELQMAGTVAAYYSVGAEPDTRGLVYALWKRGTYVLLPLLRPTATWTGPPTRARTRWCPGRAACTNRGSRPAGPTRWPGPTWCWSPRWPWTTPGTGSGRGGGSYDRALARVGPLIPVIALLYDAELLGHVPAEPHDTPVRAVVRPEAGITWLPAVGSR